MCVGVYVCVLCWRVRWRSMAWVMVTSVVCAHCWTDDHAASGDGGGEDDANDPEDEAVASSGDESASALPLSSASATNAKAGPRRARMPGTAKGRPRTLSGLGPISAPVVGAKVPLAAAAAAVVEVPARTEATRRML
jgi:hypothetical protein